MSTSIDVSDAAMEFLQLCWDTTNAHVAANARENKDDDTLAYKAHMLSERKETARRQLGDAIAKIRPDLKSRLRRVNALTYDGPSYGSVNSVAP